MKKERNKNRETQQQEDERAKDPRKEKHSSAFQEPQNKDVKTTINTEEANLEQERKEAMTERD